jgi:putative ABC transport system substrate-binding protein
MDCNVVRVYRDHGVSGAEGREERPQFNRLCRDATKREFDAIMAWSVDRLGYGAGLVDMYQQVGAYTGQILKGAKPADLPVVQSTKFEFVLNLHTARLLGIEVPPTMLAIADDVIE